MPNPWFRVYYETLDDEEFQMMTHAHQRHFLMLLALRCKSGPIETFRETRIAFALKISLQELLEAKAVFIENGYIDDKWNILNWDKRQYVSDSSTGRVREFRQRKKEEAETMQMFETDPQRYETTPEADTEADTEAEKNKQKRSVERKASTDQRFGEFRQDFQSAFVFQNSVPAPWDAKEANQLSRWLKSNPTISRDQWRTILSNRKRSPLNKAAPLSQWISKALSWLPGPADEWGKSLTPNGRSNGKVPVGKTEGNMAILAESLARGKHQSSSDKDGVFQASRNGPVDAGTVHNLPLAAGPSSISSGHGDDF